MLSPHTCASEPCDIDVSRHSILLRRTEVWGYVYWSVVWLHSNAMLYIYACLQQVRMKLDAACGQRKNWDESRSIGMETFWAVLNVGQGRVTMGLIAMPAGSFVRDTEEQNETELFREKNICFKQWWHLKHWRPDWGRIFCLARTTLRIQLPSRQILRDVGVPHTHSTHLILYVCLPLTCRPLHN